jgi:hypothetical protein
MMLLTLDLSCSPCCSNTSAACWGHSGTAAIGLETQPQLNFCHIPVSNRNVTKVGSELGFKVCRSGHPLSSISGTETTRLSEPQPTADPVHSMNSLLAAKLITILLHSIRLPKSSPNHSEFPLGPTQRCWIIKTTTNFPTLQQA